MNDSSLPAGDIDAEVAAYLQRQKELEARHLGKWVVFHRQEMMGTYETFEAAAADAVARFGRGPYLIRQVGAPPVILPAAVMFQLSYA